MQFEDAADIADVPGTILDDDTERWSGSTERANMEPDEVELDVASINFVLRCEVVGNGHPVRLAGNEAARRWSAS